jgi:hypothetical protein
MNKKIQSQPIDFTELSDKDRHSFNSYYTDWPEQNQYQRFYSFYKQLGFTDKEIQESLNLLQGYKRPVVDLEF